ncbi:MAG TPA: S-layer homology domain-containing protein [Firmicutes bacterium]|nr:S-layer homology domain-containing protein [Bacillota bacterium]
MQKPFRMLAVFLLAAVLVTMVLPQSGLAAPKGHGGPGQAGWKGPGFKFKDIEKNWAREYITEMAAAGLVRGINEETFAPDDQVESAQVLALLVRALGLEQKALGYGYQDLTADYLAPVPLWARGYVRVAVERGLVTPEEVAQWQSGQKATRLDVARYVARLFGEEELAGTRPEGLNFTDLAGVPTDLQMYILIVAQRGIMVGAPGGRWLPFDYVNRGQMAKILSLILSRLVPLVPEPVRQQVYGEIVQVTAGDADEAAAVTLKTQQGQLTYTLAAECAVYVDGKAAEVEDLAPGQRAWLVLARSEDGTVRVVYIRAQTPAPQKVEAEGTISALTLGLDASITVRAAGGQETTFTVDDDTVITLAGRDVFLSDLELGQEVRVEGFRTGDRLVATEIAAEPEEEEVAGRLTAIVTNGRTSLTLEDKKGTRHTFRVTSRTRIRLNGRAAVLEDLRPGDEVRVQAVAGEALRVEATRPEPEEKELSGTIVTLVLGDQPSLSVKDARGQVSTYRVTDDTRISLDGKAATLDALRTGWQVDLTVKGDEALIIAAETPEPEEKEVTGTLVQLKLGGTSMLTIEDEAKEHSEYRVAENVRVRLDGKEGTLWQLKIGMQVKLYVRAGVVEKIEVQDGV